MDTGIAALRSNRAVVAAVIVAAIAVTLLALVGMAKVLGWIPPNRSLSTPMSMASPAGQVAGTAPDLGLAPGETLVAPVEQQPRPAPMMPHYAAPPAPLPAPKIQDRETPASVPPAAKPAVAASRPAPHAKSRMPEPAEPRTPSFARGDAHPTSPLDTWPNPAPCERCGRVVSTTTWPHMAEVRVVFEDGSTRTLRSPSPSPWHVGDRVRLEHGHLLRH